MSETVASIQLKGEQLAQSATRLHSAGLGAISELQGRLKPTGSNGYTHFEAGDQSFVAIKRVQDGGGDEVRLTTKKPAGRGHFQCGQLLVRIGEKPTVKHNQWLTTDQGHQDEEGIENHPSAEEKGGALINDVASFGLTWGRS